MFASKYTHVDDCPGAIRVRNQIAPSSLFGPQVGSLSTQNDNRAASDQPSISVGTDSNSNPFEPSHLLFVQIKLIISCDGYGNTAYIKMFLSLFQNTLLGFQNFRRIMAVMHPA